MIIDTTNNAFRRKKTFIGTYIIKYHIFKHWAEVYYKYYHYFSGPRICLGESFARMELSLFFANLLAMFDFQLHGEVRSLGGQLPGITLIPPPFSLVAASRV